MKYFSVTQLTRELREMCAKSTQRAVAGKLGILQSNLNHLLAGRQKIGPKMADLMGYDKAEDRYVKREKKA